MTVYEQATLLQALNSNVTKNDPKLLAQTTTLVNFSLSSLAVV